MRARRAHILKLHAPWRSPLRLGAGDVLLIAGAVVFIVLAALVAYGGSPFIVGLFAAFATGFAYLLGTRRSSRVPGTPGAVGR